MKEVTLDELTQEIKAKEALMKEPEAVTKMIKAVGEAVIEAAESGKVTILTDYDADGICSAYIMEKTLKAISPDCEITVECNDRREAYGLSENIQGEDGVRYIVCDMGSNQLDLAREKLGENVIIIDHHLIESDSVREEFANLDNTNLCNPHALNKKDEQNAQYCATGLAYRTYQEAARLCASLDKPFNTNERQENTLAIMACIGTATDMVNVADVHSLNRVILKDGLQRIDNADEQNLDFIIGNVLAKCKVEDQVTAHQIAFNVGAFLNSASRMSEVMNENGAQRMYNAITGDPNKVQTYRELDALFTLNDERKSYVAQLTSSDEYKKFLEDHRFGANANDNIGVFRLPDNTPAAFAGLVANKLAEATDKAIICLTYNEEKQAFTGSGRNVENNKTSLKEFLDLALFETGDGLEVKYGGHENAVGISSLNDIDLLRERIEVAKTEMQAKSVDDRTFLKISPADLTSPETLAQLQQAIEPTGVGLQLPPVVVEGVEMYREKLFKKDREDWKTVRINHPDAKNSIDIADWAYSPKAYPQFGDMGKNIKVIAELGISDYRGQHIELTAKTDRQLFAQTVKAIRQEKNEKALPNISSQLFAQAMSDKTTPPTGRD